MFEVCAFYGSALGLGIFYLSCKITRNFDLVTRIFDPVTRNFKIFSLKISNVMSKS